jgi:putative nucleotidyltransferase with HDIG domain
MEAKHATDCAPWKDSIDPVAARSVAGAIDDLAEFPVLDATVLRVIALCDDQDSTAADLVDALEQDATFAANLLRFANSAARSHPIRAKTIRQAVMLVGRRALRRLALEAATFRFLERCRGNGRASCGQLHLHAITVALGAAACAEEARIPGDTIHLAGLLHDVGKLVLPEVFGEEACDAVARDFPAGAERVLAERERFGIDHAQCGALLAERWGLPAEVASIIAWHHGGPTGVGAPNPDIACVQLSDNVAGMLAGVEADHALLEVALDRVGLTSDVLDVLADEMTQTDQRGEAGRLAQRVAELERLSQTDDLTGLANRRHWLQTTRTALGRSSSSTSTTSRPSTSATAWPQATSSWPSSAGSSATTATPDGSAATSSPCSCPATSKRPCRPPSGSWPRWPRPSRPAAVRRSTSRWAARRRRRTATSWPTCSKRPTSRCWTPSGRAARGR